MIVRCPKCRGENRLVEVSPGERVFNILCQACEQIVRVDLSLDEVRSSSSSSAFGAVERRRKVLVADDSQLVLRMAGDLLTEAGFTVITAADGAAALQRVEEDHPDVVVLDLLMPKLTGFDVLREIKKNDRTRATPVLVMSGVYKEDVVSHLGQMGAAGFMDKDLLAETLVFRVRAVLADHAPREHPKPGSSV